MSDIAWDWIGIVGGLGLLVLGGESLVRGASRLAAALRISPLVIGLTVVAFGTSAPELAVSVQSTVSGNGDIALGNVVGSNIFNVLFILGASALIVPLVVSSHLIRRDVPIMILVSVLVLALGWDLRITRWEGVALFAGIIAYTWHCIRTTSREAPAVQQEFAQEWSPAEPRATRLGLNVVFIVTGLVLLVLGARLLVAGAVSVAGSLGVSELVIGVTIVAAGTSLPEVMTSLIAAIRGERDIAVGNVIGSNIFNILCVLGLSSAIPDGGVAVNPGALSFDVPVMIGVAIACLPVFFTGTRHIALGRGPVSFSTTWRTPCISCCSRPAAGGGLRSAPRSVLFVIPLTAVTLAIGAWRSVPRGNRPGDTGP